LSYENKLKTRQFFVVLYFVNVFVRANSATRVRDNNNSHADADNNIFIHTSPGDNPQKFVRCAGSLCVRIVRISFCAVYLRHYDAAVVEIWLIMSFWTISIHFVLVLFTISMFEIKNSPPHPDSFRSFVRIRYSIVSDAGEFGIIIKGTLIFGNTRVTFPTDNTLSSHAAHNNYWNFHPYYL